METRQPFVNTAAPNALGLDFNQHGKFTVATNKGFRIHSTRDAKLLIEREFGGSLAFASTLENSNILGLISGGESPKWSPNKVRSLPCLTRYLRLTSVVCSI